MYLAPIGGLIGLFVLPVTEETGFSRTTVTGAFPVAAVGTAVGTAIVWSSSRSSSTASPRATSSCR
ncbi:hypothetical protein [Streptomyces sp. NPDC127033]|uniref:hypothetical protein n=1 Tax=Streptomyces sp. NPDC127033 TaxID=3347110 RepID=UPI003661ECFE